MTGTAALPPCRFAGDVVKGFEPSLLDKLCADDDLGSVRRRLNIEQLKDTVARDLEALLNARSTFSDDWGSRYPAVAGSVAAYGLTDFAGLSMASIHDRQRICQSLELAIERHEPRLRNVRVSLEVNRYAINSLIFSIHALLVVRPAREAVSFDALLQPTTLQYSVNRSSGRQPSR